jgi:hypothetical protein
MTETGPTDGTPRVNAGERLNQSTPEIDTRNPVPSLPSSSPFLHPPLDDFWAHQVAEKAKIKVLGYFAITTVLIGAVSFLYGKETIDRAVEAEVKSVINAKSPLVDQQIDALMQPQKAKIANLAKQVADLSALIDQYRAKSENEYTSFSAFIVGSQEQVVAMISSLPKHDTPIAPVPQNTIDLSSSIGMIFDINDSPAGEGATALYAIISVLSKSGRHIELSPQGAFYGAGGSDTYGVVAVTLLDYLRDNGAYRASDWPKGVKTKPTWARPVARITGYSKTQSTKLEDITRELRAGNVVIAEMAIDPDFLAYKSGIYNAAKGVPAGEHLMAVVGFDETAGSVKLANTWGNNWGEGGFIRLGTKAFLDRVRWSYWISGVEEL